MLGIDIVQPATEHGLMVNHPDNGIRFGQRLQALLDENPERNQAWLAEKTGLERSTISRIIKGERSAAPDTLQTLAVALALTPAELVAGTDAEARLAAVSSVVPRATYDAVVKTLLDYEGRIADLERRLRHFDADEVENRATIQKLRRELAAAVSEREELQRAVERLQARLTETELDLERHRDALKKAVADVASLSARLQKIATDSSSAATTGAIAAALASVAAVAGVATLAHYLASAEPHPTGPMQRERPSSRRRAPDGS